MLLYGETSVNTSVFARWWPKTTVNTVLFATRGKKHHKYSGFGLPIHQTHWYLRCFLLREFQRRAKTLLIWRFSATTEPRQKAAGVTPTPTAPPPLLYHRHEQQEEEEEQEQQQQEQEEE